MKRLVLLAATTLTGCGFDPGVTAAPVEITGRVTLKGRPLSDAILHLQPTKSGAQAALPVTNGVVRGTVTPGAYAYYLEGKKPAVSQAIPARFRTGSLETIVEVAQGTALDISVN